MFYKFVYRYEGATNKKPVVWETAGRGFGLVAGESFRKRLTYVCERSALTDHFRNPSHSVRVGNLDDACADFHNAPFPQSRKRSGGDGDALGVPYLPCAACGLDAPCMPFPCYELEGFRAIDAELAAHVPEERGFFLRIPRRHEAVEAELRNRNQAVFAYAMGYEPCVHGACYRGAGAGFLQVPTTEKDRLHFGVHFEHANGRLANGKRQRAEPTSFVNFIAMDDEIGGFLRLLFRSFFFSGKEWENRHGQAPCF